jgi:hypothetical protein
LARKIEIEIVGDTKGFQKSLSQASDSSSKFGTSLAKAGKVAALGLGAGLAVVGVGLKKSVDAALEAEKAQTRLDAAFKSANVTAKERATAMSEVSKVSARAALDDEDLMDTLGRLTRVTGEAGEAQRGMAIASDLARGRGIELEAATKIVEKAYLGNVGALKRIGIEIPKVTEAQDALKASSEKATAEQIKAAKAADDTATRQSAIAALQKQYAGASEEYGRTAAGAQDRFKVAVENLQESIGQKLLPVVTRLLEWVISNMPTFERVASTAMKRVGQAIDALEPVVMAVIAVIRSLVSAAQAAWPKVQQAAEDVADWYRTNLRPAIENVIRAVTVLWNKFGDDVLKIASAAFNTVKTVVQNALRIVQAVITGVLALIRGDWSEAWKSLKTAVSASLDSVKAILSGFVGVVRGLAGALFTAAAELGYAIGKGIIAGIQAMAGAVAGAVKSILSVSGIDVAKAILQSRSPSKVFAGIGRDTIEGYILGITSQQPALSGKMAETISKALDAARDKVASYQGVLADAFGRLGDFAKRAFDKKTQNILDNVTRKFDAQIAKWQGYADALTPAEKELAAIDKAEETRSREAAARAAQDALTAANAMEAGVEKERAIAAAQEQIRQAALADRRAALQADAETQRAAREKEAAEHIAKLEATKARELQNLEERRNQLATKLDEQLATLQNRLSKHPEEYDKIQKQIQKLLASYGIPMQKSGELLGKAFARGLNDAADDVRRSARKLADIVADYLKLRSPAKKGPLSTLPSWWKPMGPMLAKQMQLGAGRVAAGAAGMAGGASAVPAGAAVGGGGVVNYNFTFPNYVGDKRELIQTIRTEVKRTAARN